MSNKSYFSKEPIFWLFKPPLECQRPIYKLHVKPHSSMTSLQTWRHNVARDVPSQIT
jgi:hypothetical protein